MNEQKTLTGDQHSNRPPENEETRWWREFLCKIVFGLWYEKKEILEKMGFPPRAISQREIFKEKCRRVQMLKDEGLWGTTRDYPYSSDHNHNFCERRINESVTDEFAPKVNGINKIVCVSKRKGLYQPNPKLFSN